MSSETSSIILTGQTLPEHDINDVIVALAKLLKTTEEKALGLLAGRETVIKRDVPAARVGRYLQALSQAGAAARSEPATVTSAPAQVVLSAVVADASIANQPSPLAASSRQSGALSLEPVVSQPSPVPVDKPTTVAELSIVETVICPQCGHAQPKRTLCQQCGCDMPRVRAAKEQAKAEEEVARAAFQAPKAALVNEDEHNETMTPKMLGISLTGRIGRLRYIAYGWAAIFPFIAVGLLASFALSGRSALGSLLIGVAALLCGWLMIRLTVLRMHDVDLSGKWLLGLLVLSGVGGVAGMPALVVGASFVFWFGWLVLLFWPGTAGDNRHGLPCGPNTTPVAIGAGLVLLFMAIGLSGVQKTMDAYKQRSATTAGTGAKSDNPEMAEARESEPSQDAAQEARLAPMRQAVQIELIKREILTPEELAREQGDLGQEGGAKKALRAKPSLAMTLRLTNTSDKEIAAYAATATVRKMGSGSSGEVRCGINLENVFSASSSIDVRCLRTVKNSPESRVLFDSPESELEVSLYPSFVRFADGSVMQ